MKWDAFLNTTQDLPLVSTGMLLTAFVERGDVEKQLSRWVKARKILQLRRGLYALAEPFRKQTPHPYCVANALCTPSYVSLQSALSLHGLIPETVFTITSVTTSRPGKFATPLGNHLFRHVQKDFFCGYSALGLPEDQTAFVAEPEKALLDLIYLTPHADKPEWLDALRLQNLDLLDLEKLKRWAGSSAKLLRACRHIARLKRAESYETR
jgi:predicted transcriptional regulator of viral defense system